MPQLLDTDGIGTERQQNLAGAVMFAGIVAFFAYSTASGVVPPVFGAGGMVLVAAGYYGSQVWSK